MADTPRSNRPVPRTAAAMEAELRRRIRAELEQARSEADGQLEDAKLAEVVARAIAAALQWHLEAPEHTRNASLSSRTWRPANGPRGDRPPRRDRDFDRPPPRDFDRPPPRDRDFDRPPRDFDRSSPRDGDFDRPPPRDFDRPPPRDRDFDRPPPRDFKRGGGFGPRRGGGGFGPRSGGGGFGPRRPPRPR